jgi:hypothetical protein
MKPNRWVIDGNLVTGQNQNAGPMVAREMLPPRSGAFKCGRALTRLILFHRDRRLSRIQHNDEPAAARIDTRCAPRRSGAWRI